MSKRWFSKHINDPFVKQANREGLRSRAAYKLLEIQEKQKIIKRSDRVLDLGSAPGAWSEALTKIVGQSGRVVSCDLLAMTAIKGVSFIQGDFLLEDTQTKIKQVCQEFDVIVSDMAPNLTGNKVVDQMNMLKLIQQSIAFSKVCLKQEGHLVIKCFSGAMFEEAKVLFKSNFESVKVFKPDASRSTSKEIYLIGLRFGV